MNELDQYSSLRARIVAAQRQALLEMRSKDEIGDDAFHQIEAQLDVAGECVWGWSIRERDAQVQINLWLCKVF